MERERFRERAPATITAEYLADRAAQGLLPVEIVWQRVPLPGGRKSAAATSGEVKARASIPYGWRVAEDGSYLEHDAAEIAALQLMLDRLIAEQSFRSVADELNAIGVPTRDGSPWTSVAVFELVPRMVDCAPALFREERWPEARARRRAVSAGAASRESASSGPGAPRR